MKILILKVVGKYIVGQIFKVNMNSIMSNIIIQNNNVQVSIVFLV